MKSPTAQQNEVFERAVKTDDKDASTDKLFLYLVLAHKVDLSKYKRISTIKSSVQGCINNLLGILFYDTMSTDKSKNGIYT